MLEALRSEFGATIEKGEQVGKELHLGVSSRALVGVCEFLKARGYDYLHDLTAVDTGSELRVVYRLISRGPEEQAVIEVRAARSGAVVPSLTGVYRAADWPEREVYDLFGVRFAGHPDLRRIMLAEDWSGHPLLKQGT
jgi:NADH-quinone oxidoreductase subunit C